MKSDIRRRKWEEKKRQRGSIFGRMRKQESCKIVVVHRDMSTCHRYGFRYGRRLIDLRIIIVLCKYIQWGDSGGPLLPQLSSPLPTPNVYSLYKQQISYLEFTSL